MFYTFFLSSWFLQFQPARSAAIQILPEATWQSADSSSGVHWRFWVCLNAKISWSFVFVWAVSMLFVLFYLYAALCIFCITVDIFVFWVIIEFWTVPLMLWKFFTWIMCFLSLFFFFFFLFLFHFWFWVFISLSRISNRLCKHYIVVYFVSLGNARFKSVQIVCKFIKKDFRKPATALWARLMLLGLNQWHSNLKRRQTFSGPSSSNFWSALIFLQSAAYCHLSPT